MTILRIYDNNINDFINCNPLEISELKISSPVHIEQILNNLHKFVNLRTLWLNHNKITEIKGLDNLVNLRTLWLNHNKITEIKGLDNLVNLQELYLHDNQITEIIELDNLVNLHMLYLGNNNIKVLPLFLCNYNYVISIYNNPIEHIPLPVQRWLTRNNIYNNGKNIHNIQISFRNSLINLLKDKPTINLETVKNEIISSNILTEQTKREILNYCDGPTKHYTYLITYSDLLIYVWSRIRNKNEILKVLNQEITNGLCMCFTGRMRRLLNVLVGFYDDIELQISDSKQITNIIMNLKTKVNEDQLKDAFKKELLERQYSEDIINEWLEYI